MERLLAVDIGGTKTSVGIFSKELGPRAPIYAATLESKRYKDVKSLLDDFLLDAADRGAGIETAVLGVAGPVVDNASRLTNLPWLIEGDALKKAFSLSSVRLLNDLEAMVWAVSLLIPSELSILKDGEKRIGDPIALIAPGTGLGEAFLTGKGPSLLAIATVGGHADFAPTDSLQVELLEHLTKSRGRVSYENVCSGPGIFNIYDFLKETGKASQPAWLADRMAKAGDPTPVIVEAALEKKRGSKICSMAVEVFASILGAEAGNMALRGMATGGVYVGGGIVPRLRESFDGRKFSKSFCDKGPMSFLVERIPVYLIEKKDAALLGAAAYGLERCAY